MKIAVIGAGGVGGYFGARLAAAGEDVSFIQRGAHFLAMKERGLRVDSKLGNIVLTAVKVTEDASEIGPVDIVLVAVKSGQTDAAAALCKPLLRQNTGVITLQNGVENEERLSERIGCDHVLGGVVYILSLIESPGIIRHSGEMARIEFGELDGSESKRGQSFLSACRRASIEAELTNNILTSLWRKFIFLCPHNGLTALTRSAIGRVREDPDCRALLEEAVLEVIELASAKGIGVTSTDVSSFMERYDGLPESMTSSMHHDVVNGKPLELDWLNGAVVRLAREHGIATPVNQFIYAALKLFRSGTVH